LRFYRATARRWLVAALLCATALGTQAGETLERVRERRMLACGVGKDIPGFAEQDSAGTWRGMDVDFCRAVAAAVLGDAERVRFVALEVADRFPALLVKRVDLLSAEVTWTLGREAGLGVQFGGVLLYDHQGFLARGAPAGATLERFAGARVCTTRGATHGDNLAAYAAQHGWRYEPAVFDSLAAATDAFARGDCALLTDDASALAGIRAHFGANVTLLPDEIAREPLAPVVRSDDEAWRRIVQWVLFLLIAADSYGVTQAHARALLRGEQPVDLPSLPPRSPALAAALGVGPKWMEQVIAAVGNHGEMFERNLGAASPLGLPRGPNRPWTAGGLLFAPPLR
jgi:general L-amino acid transport system substrate-binding protein